MKMSDTSPEKEIEATVNEWGDDDYSVPDELKLK